jgi:hypothetical protein
MAGARVVFTLSESDTADPFLTEASSAQQEGFFSFVKTKKSNAAFSF